MPVIGEVRVNLPAIEQELHEKLALRDSLDESIRELEMTLNTIQRYTIGRAGEPQERHESATSNNTTVDPYNGMTQSDIALKVLREQKKPMRARDIVDVMIANGYHAADRVKAQNAIFTSMDRKKGEVFVKIESGLWDLVERNGN